ncbi:putative PAS/PAC sensor protein [Methanoregula boonei 6A8]|uniref:Putative PAS/PAC sensor protein n=1 Tax=Methanoregula boonei (strain DSM 21154 / JCM 14090 / 6A8) TaxID=456442 RepID=A7I7A8_METB6|nr:PAS domain-containing sensor histidine kinase [Methanoregula boonei]ABS55619.1 putative PAS/PAC sensor protein [Methanoregula boonei 6A8]
MQEHQEEISRIREELEQHPEGLSITDIAGLLGLNRNSVARYMDLLQIQGLADGRKRGTSKVYYRSRRVPADSLREICFQPFVTFDQDGVATDYNPAFSRFAGLSREQILGRALDTFPFRIPEGGTLQQVFRTAFKGGEQQVQASLLIKGEEHSLRLILVPLVFATGKPGVAVIADTDRGEAAVGQNPQSPFPEFQKLLDHQVEYVVRYSPEGIILYVNEPYCRAMARSREDLIGRPFKHLVPGEDTERIAANRARLNPKYPAGMIEFRAIMANGEARWQRWWDHALFDDRGQLAGYFSCGLDITEEVMVRGKLKKTQDMLEETIIARTNELREINRQLYDEMTRRETMEQQLLMTQFAMDNAADMVFWINRNGVVDYANKAAVEGGGYSAVELAATGLGDLFPLPSAYSWNNVWDHLKREGTIQQQIEMIKKDGTRIPVEIVLRYLAYHKSEFVCCFVRDVSERKRMEHTLHLANRKLNVLASITRHDIQNKVTVLLGYLTRARKRETDPEIREYLDRQERAAKAIRDEISLTRDFKDLGTDSPEWLNIRDLVGAAAKRFGDSAPRFSLELPENLLVYADRQIERVFLRLFETALNSPSPPQSIRIFSRGDQDRIVICVEHEDAAIMAEATAKNPAAAEEDMGERSLAIIREILSLTDITLEKTGEPGKSVCYEIVIPAVSYRYSSRIED